ncbi:MAG: metallophosphoesterase family protein [Verrucomicrobiota bacterium]|nr:metallophosphoesterase family protein [Verrucomicrobiota bacterium]
MKIGVISDTHGLIRDELLEKLCSVDYILHAGDIGDIDVYNRLKEIAPLIAVRGNMDQCLAIPSTECVELEGRQIYLIHDLELLSFIPKVAGFDVIIHGHTHQPERYIENEVLYLNPGSAGPRRYSKPISMAYLYVSKEDIDVEFVEL